MFLVKEMRPDTVTSYNNLRVSFYDKLVEVKKDGKLVNEERLYIAIDNNKDRYSSIRRKPIKKKVPVGAYGDLKLVSEKDLYKRAYEKYKLVKDQGDVKSDLDKQEEKQTIKLKKELETKSRKEKELEKRIKELESKNDTA